MSAGVSALTLMLLGTLVYWVQSNRTTKAAAQQLLTNAVPSVKLLTATRSSLRVVDAALHQVVSSMQAGQPEIAEQALSYALAARREMSSTFTAYQALPTYVEEPALQARAHRALAQVDEALNLIEEVIRRKNAKEVERLEFNTWRPISEGVDSALGELVIVNVEHAVGHAQHIDRIGGRAFFLVYASAAVGLGLAVIAIVLGGRAIRRHVSFEQARAAELEMFASRLAHDLMSPLNATGLALQSLMRREPQNGGTAKLGYESLKRARAIIDGLLDFAKAGGRPDSAARSDVAEAIQSTVQALRGEAEREGIELMHGELPASAVRCASGVLSTVLDNLTRNAIKFMNGVPVRRVELRARNENDHVSFEVEDSGPGFPAGFEEKAFQAYLRGPNANGRPGLGLGLATVRKLVTAHGGAVGVRRASPSGTVFWFTLPAAREQT